MAPKSKLTKEDVKKIIHDYKTTKKAMGLIEPAQIARFNQELFESGEVSHVMEASFWRKKGRLGRDLIDEANEVFSHKLTTSQGQKVEISNVSDLVLKYGHDKEKLITELTLLQTQLLASNKRENKLKQEVLDSNSRLDKQKKEIAELRQQLDILQELIFKMIQYSTVDDVPLLNQLDIQNAEVGIFKEALEGMFDIPIKFYDWYENKVNENMQINDRQENLVLMSMKKEKNSLAASIKSRHKGR